MSKEEDLFYKEMMDVVPLTKRTRPQSTSRKFPSLRADLYERRRSAVTSKSEFDNYLVDNDVPPLDAFYILDFKRNGVQNGVYKKLKQGAYQYDAKLDLHRLSVKQSRNAVFEFIHKAHFLGYRTLLLIHGKGRTVSVEKRKSVLKGFTNVWLRQIPVVQAFHSARNRDGGTGAVYILLSKSEESKNANRSRYR